MRKLFALLACCALTHLSAQVFENFDYHFPNQGQGWKEIFSLKNLSSEEIKNFPEGCNIIHYAPESFVVDGANEHVEMFMIMSTNDVVTNLNDTEAFISEIKSGLAVASPNASFTVTILETAPNSVICEIVGIDEDQLVTKLLNRTILHSQKLICFSYMTNDIHRYEMENFLWLQALREIKLAE